MRFPHKIDDVSEVFPTLQDQYRVEVEESVPEQQSMAQVDSGFFKSSQDDQLRMAFGVEVPSTRTFELVRVFRIPQPVGQIIDHEAKRPVEVALEQSIDHSLRGFKLRGAAGLAQLIESDRPADQHDARGGDGTDRRCGVPTDQRSKCSASASIFIPHPQIPRVAAAAGTGEGSS